MWSKPDLHPLYQKVTRKFTRKIYNKKKLNTAKFTTQQQIYNTTANLQQHKLTLYSTEKNFNRRHSNFRTKMVWPFTAQKCHSEVKNKIICHVCQKYNFAMRKTMFLIEMSVNSCNKLYTDDRIINSSHKIINIYI